MNIGFPVKPKSAESWKCNYSQVINLKHSVSKTKERGRMKYEWRLEKWQNTEN